MFRNNKLLMKRKEIMHQNDIERFAFLYLCGQRDRELLGGKVKMTFQDFDRLIFITESLGLSQMNLEIWNRFSPQFLEQLGAMEKLYEENGEEMGFSNYDENERSHDKWIADFCYGALDEEVSKFLSELFGIFYKEGEEVT